MINNMKSFIFALLLICPLGMLAQNVSEDVRQEIARLKDNAHQKFENQKYVSAIDTAQKAIDIIDASGYDSEEPALKPYLYVLQARCHFRNEQWQKAVDATQKGIEFYGKNVSADDETYYNYIDNMSLYLISLDRYDEALEWNTKAVNFFEKNNIKNIDYAAVMIHRADIYFKKKEYDNALSSQRIATEMMKELRGIHSNEFISEMVFLKNIYDGMGDTTSVAKMDSVIEKLSMEAQCGYIPENREIQTAEQAHDSMEDALMCSRYLLTHYMNTQEWHDAAKYILAWLTVSPDVSLFVSDAEEEWIKDKVGAMYLSAYMAGWIQYAIQEKDTEQSLAAYSSAVIDMLNFYSANQHLSGDVKVFDEYIDTYNKNEEKFFEKIKSNYDNYIRALNSLSDAQKSKINVKPEDLKPSTRYVF